MKLQIGGGLNGSLEESYVEYNTSLVSDCLQDPSPGCSLTIALWAYIPERTVCLFSTVETNRNGGFYSVSAGGGIYMYWNTGLNASFIYARSVLNEWTHIAFAYQNTLGTPEFELYINFETNSVANYSNAVPTEFLPEAFMGSGNVETFGVTGFGVIDELLVFPEYLSASQIAQLKDNSD